jgi:hypothetical protein
MKISVIDGTATLRIEKSHRSTKMKLAAALEPCMFYSVTSRSYMGEASYKHIQNLLKIIISSSFWNENSKD